MKILGIDPGTALTGFAIIEAKNDSIVLIECGCIKTMANLPQPERLNEIATDLDSIIKKHKPSELAIEKLFFSKNVRTAMSVSEARGVMIQTAYSNGLHISEYSPNEVKSLVTGDGKADKLQMQKMIMLLLNLKEVIKPDDVADAVAIALTHSQQLKFKTNI